MVILEGRTIDGVFCVLHPDLTDRGEFEQSVGQYGVVVALITQVLEVHLPATPVWRKAYSLGVVLASKGYPGSYQKGFAIKNLDQVDAHVAHMGTAFKDGQLVTNGGRVLMVIAEGPTIAAAREKVYAEVAKIDCDSLFYRNDIAHCAFE